MAKHHDGAKTLSQHEQHTNEADENDGSRALSTGEMVVDRGAEPDDRNTAVVIGRLDTPAYAVRIDALDASVADVNENYPPDSLVVTVAFADALGETLGDWTEIPVGSLEAICNFQGVQTYLYPVARLQEVKP